MGRRQFHILALSSVLLMGLVVAMWVRSYWRHDRLRVRLGDEGHTVHSRNGRLTWNRPPEPVPGEAAAWETVKALHDRNVVWMQDVRTDEREENPRPSRMFLSYAPVPIDAQSARLYVRPLMAALEHSDQFCL